MKSISQRLRASKVASQQEARKATQEAMNASIYPPKFRPIESATGVPECASGLASSARAGASVAASCVDEKMRYIEQEIAAGLSVFHVPSPLNNMGVTGVKHGNREAIEYDGTELICFKPKSKGRYSLVLVPGQIDGIDSRIGFIDQISFTVRTSTVCKRDTAPPFAEIQGKWPEIDAVSRISSALVHIFGFGVTSQLEKGRNFYTHSYSLGDHGEYGAVSCGGNNNNGSTANTANIQVTGQGCLMAAPGWEKRLFDYLTAMYGHISRIDIAADLYHGQYSPEQAYIDWEDGKFSLTNRKPHIQLHGSSWHNEQAKDGKTITVGKRESGKCTRVYEKGKEQLGKIAASMIDENHPLFHLQAWTRIETEWHRTNRELPLEMLLEPGKYLAGAHPAALGWLSEIQEKIQTIKRKAQATVQRAEEVLVRQMGSTMKALKELGRLEHVLARIDGCKLPKWVNGFDSPDPHDEKWITFEKELAMIPF